MQKAHIVSLLVIVMLGTAYADSWDQYFIELPSYVEVGEFIEEPVTKVSVELGDVTSLNNLPTANSQTVLAPNGQHVPIERIAKVRLSSAMSKISMMNGANGQGNINVEYSWTIYIENTQYRQPVFVRVSLVSKLKPQVKYETVRNCKNTIMGEQCEDEVSRKIYNVNKDQMMLIQANFLRRAKLMVREEGRKIFESKDLIVE